MGKKKKTNASCWAEEALVSQEDISHVLTTYQTRRPTGQTRAETVMGH